MDLIKQREYYEKQRKALYKRFIEPLDNKINDLNKTIENLKNQKEIEFDERGLNRIINFKFDDEK